MRAYHRGRLLFCPRNSHFDQFEFFAGAATVDFTTETSSPLFVSSSRLFFVSSFRFSLSLLFFPPLRRYHSSLFFPRPPHSRSLITFLSERASPSLVRTHTLNLIFYPTCSFRRHSDSLARSCWASVTFSLDREGYSDGLLAGGGSDTWHSSVLRIAAEVPRTRCEFRLSYIYKCTKDNDFIFRSNIVLSVVNSVLISKLIDT